MQIPNKSHKSPKMREVSMEQLYSLKHLFRTKGCMPDKMRELARHITKAETTNMETLTGAELIQLSHIINKDLPPPEIDEIRKEVSVVLAQVSQNIQTRWDHGGYDKVTLSGPLFKGMAEWGMVDTLLGIYSLQRSNPPVIEYEAPQYYIDDGQNSYYYYTMFVPKEEDYIAVTMLAARVRSYVVFSSCQYVFCSLQMHTLLLLDVFLAYTSWL